MGKKKRSKRLKPKQVKELKAKEAEKILEQDVIAQSAKSLDGLFADAKTKEFNVGALFSDKTNKAAKNVFKWVVMAVSVLTLSTLAYNHYSNNDTGLRVEYMEDAKEESLPYMTVHNRFKVKGERRAIFSYVDEKGLKFVLYDLEANEPIFEDIINGGGINEDSLASLTQALPHLLDKNKELSGLDKGQGVWRVNGRDMKMTIDGFKVTALNSVPIAPNDIYFLAASHQELIERNKIDVNMLDIGFIGSDPGSGQISIAATDQSGKIYSFIQYLDGRVKLQIKNAG